MSLMTAHTQMGISLRFMGDYADAVEHFEKAGAIYDPARQREYTTVYHMDPGVFSFAETTRTFWAVGRIEEAIAMNERSMTLGRSNPDPRTIAFALLMSSVLSHLMRDPEATMQSSSEGIAICDEHQIMQERSWITTAHGWAIALLGNQSDGLDEMAASLTMRKQMNAILDFPYALAQLAEGHMLMGNLALARATLEEALDLRRRHDDAWFEAEVHRMLGDVEFAETGNTAAAESFYRESLDIARKQGTKSFELRTATSLARLLGHERSAEAIALLEPVRQWFSSQRPTRDSATADEVLAMLRGTAGAARA